MRLLKQLFSAVAWLRQGGVLWKYREGTLVDDSWHPRFVKLSGDLKQLLWTRVPGATMSTPRLTKKNSQSDLHEKGLPMEYITALAVGAKTMKMKKGTKAADADDAAPSMLTRTATLVKGSAPKPTHVKEDCSFSIISRERTLDLAADSPELRAKWMGYLQLLLVQQHTFNSASVLNGVSAAPGDAGLLQQLESLSGKVSEIRHRTTQHATRMRSKSRADMHGKSSRLTEAPGSFERGESESGGASSSKGKSVKLLSDGSGEMINAQL